MDNILLSEYSEWIGELSPIEVAAVQRELPRQIELRPTVDRDRYLLRANAYVGAIVLPSGRSIIIEPKTPVETLFALLAAVYDPGKEVFRETIQPYATIRDLFEFVVDIYLTHVEDLIARGLLRGYRRHTEELVPIRGRIDFQQTIKQRPGLFDRHVCNYSHFTPDIAENRILNWTCWGVRQYRYRDTLTPGRIRRVLRTLVDVHLDPAARDLFTRLAEHRLNDHYQPALRLAQLLLDHLTFSGSSGENPFLSFLIDMNWLFERYLGTIVRRGALNWGLDVREQFHRHLDADRQLLLKPDIVVLKQGRPLLVIDAKYKLAAAQDDVYQMLAYCHALHIDRAVLVLPATAEVPDRPYVIRGEGTTFSVTHRLLGLSGDHVQLKRDADRLISQLETFLPELEHGATRFEN